MSDCPILQQPFEFEPWQDTSCSLSPKKWSIAMRTKKITTKLMPSDQSANILFTQQRIPSKTQPKFYQKTQKRMQNAIYKQKIDSIKPITCHEYNEKQFLIEPKSKRGEKGVQIQREKTNTEGQQFHAPCIGLINPMYINVKSNPKRLVNSCQLTKDKPIQSQFISRNINKKVYQSSNFQNQPNQTTPSISPVKKQTQSQSLYFRIVSEMNEYFNSMKLMSFKNNKTTQQISKRNIRSQSEKRNHEESQKAARYRANKIHFRDDQQDENLNIIGLRPKTNEYQKIDRNNSSNHDFSKSPSKYIKRKQSMSISKVHQHQNFISTEPVDNSLQTTQISKIIPMYDLIECQSIQSMIICQEIIASPVNRIKQKKLMSSMRPLTQQVKRISSPAKKTKFKGYCFGQINLPKNSPQEVYRRIIFVNCIVKVLYYKDLLWKNAFNLGLRFIPMKNSNDEQSQLKYFVGKGNNSKLIKTIMAKRWWWNLETKEENSSFVWTQLKIYSIYEKQPTYLIKYEDSKSLLSQNQKISLLDQVQPQQQKGFFDNSSLILNSQKKNLWEIYISHQENQERQRKITEQNLLIMRKRLQKKEGNQIKTIQSPLKVTNHLQFSKAIGNKKALYKVMMLYFQKVKKCHPDEIFVPLTYHITAGLQDEEYLKFLTEYYRRNKALSKTCWIVKPGELTNRGKGIKYCKDLNEIKPIVKKKQTHPNGSLKTFLIQQYLDRPLLYKGRKFDIRHYIMISSINGKLRGYFYQGGYIRTTSYKYKLDDNSPAIHLTNDAVQKYCKDYGKYEKGNKLSYQDFDEYLQEKHQSEDKNNKTTFFNTIHPQIRKISRDVIHAAYHFVDPNRKVNNFQIFGLDIMVDEQLKCYLIEVNTNPCLQLSSPVLKSVIPDMLDNAFALTLDCCYPPPTQPLHQYHKKHKYPTSLENKFQLVFDEDIDGKEIRRVYQEEGVEANEMAGMGDDDENFQSGEEDNQDY